jgi:Uma2 family endonuclease
MSTVPSRRTPPTPAKRKTTPAKKRKRGLASLRYGYRDVPIKRADGRIDMRRVPLTLEDVLHPQFGDVHVLSDAHDDDCNYLKDVFKYLFAADRSVVVLSDCGIFWDKPELKHHSPDLAVIFGVKERKDWITFDVATEGVRPALIIEVTSPATRVNDVKTKVEQYALAAVPHYIIADAVESNRRRRLKLIAYRLNGKVYAPVDLDKRGRAWLEPVNLWLGVKLNATTGGDRLALFDPATNDEIPDYTALGRARAVAEERAASAEAHARELEAELKRLRRRNGS